MPKVAGGRCDSDRSYPLHFDLRSSDTPYFRQLMGFDESFLILSLEGTLLEGDLAALAHVRVRLASQKYSFNISAHQITPHDSVLEARVRRLETVLDGLLVMGVGTDDDGLRSTNPIDRMASALRKLGYKPHATVDHRRLVRPILAKRCSEWEVRLVCGKTPLLDPPAKWLLTVHGVHMRYTLS